eukprot:3044672-Alexandrium_andersonii.AAC.1
MQTHARIELGKRWADYFLEVGDVILDSAHLSFKLPQLAFRGYFNKAPVGRYRPPLIPLSRADSEAGRAGMAKQR